MLTMLRLSLGGRLNRKGKYYLAATLVIIVILLGLLLIHERNKPKPLATTSSANSGPSNSAIASNDSKSAMSAIAAKDYQTAVNDYIEAVNSAEADGNLNQAKDLLQEAIKNIPDQNIPWQIYDDLVSVAKIQGNKSLEISSLKKAIIKAQQPNSGAPSGIVDTYNKRLKQLGASL